MISRDPLFGLSLIILLLPAVIGAYRVYTKHLNAWYADCPEITEQLEQADGLAPIPDAGLLLIGSELLWDWRQPPPKINARDTIVRASQRLHPPGIAECFQRTVAYYRPHATVIFLETEDAYEHPEESLAALELIDQRRDYLGVTPHLAIMLPLRTPANYHMQEAREAFQQSLQAWAGQRAGIYLLDLDNALARTDGTPDPHLFWPDGRTPTKAGYQLIDTALRRAVQPLTLGN